MPWRRTFFRGYGFVTHLELSALERLMRAIAAPVTREAIAHFGPGRLTFMPRGKRDTGAVWRAIFEPEQVRERIMVKIECERLLAGVTLQSEPRVLGMQTAVSYLIGVGEFRIPRPNSVLMVETLEEILSDKVRALLERPYLKGRDIYDIRHLRERLGATVVREVEERKFSCYATPFTPRRLPGFFESAGGELEEAIENDLGCFLSPEVMAVCRKDGYRAFIDSLRDLFRELQDKGVKVPT